jgi:hypothetical protein
MFVCVSQDRKRKSKHRPHRGVFIPCQPDQNIDDVALQGNCPEHPVQPTKSEDRLLEGNDESSNPGLYSSIVCCVVVLT